VEPVRRIAAYGICRNDDDQVLLVRASDKSGTPGAWSLPGGAVAHGENPKDTVVRETAAETGLSVAVSGLQDVVADMRALPERGVTIHTDRLLYTVRVRGGALKPRVDQPTDLVQWVDIGEAAALPLRAFTAVALGLPPDAVDLRPDDAPEVPSFLAVPGPDGLHRAQRFAAYAVATDPAGRLLLTRIADGYPGAGLWHLPGGGTDFGETPGPALLRELEEETGQHGRMVSLLGVASHRDAAQIGPEGFPIDWHGVRAFYLVQVDDATAPKVFDVGGSTVEARWFTPVEVDEFRAEDVLTEVTVEALAAIPRQRTR
jgi:ADP-ribose pyrophosphatase YjhB (NUDIX family)